MIKAALVLSVPFAIMGVGILAVVILRRQYILRQRLLSRAEATIVELNEEQETVPAIAASCTRTANGPVVFGS
jgi:Trk-type K+ transport system membrane component